MKLTRWASDQGEPELQELMSKLYDEGLEPAVVSDHPGTSYPTHDHPTFEVRWIISGTLTVGVRMRGGDVTLSDELQWAELNLEAGDRLDLSAGTKHWAQVGPQGVTYLAASRKK